MRPVANFYLDTASTVAVVDEPFTVSVVLSNNPKLEFDRLAFTLKFDPADIVPVVDKNAVNDWQPTSEIVLESVPEPEETKTTSDTSTTATKETATALSTSAKSTDSKFFVTNEAVFGIKENTIDRQNGMIRFDVETVEGIGAKNSGEIVQITFLPLRPARTKISFVFFEGDSDINQDPLTALSKDGVDSLGTRFRNTDGVINLDMEIYESREKAGDRPTIAKAGDRSTSDDDASDVLSTHLHLIARQKVIDIGDTIDIDVYLENPNSDQIDTVNLLIAYNPRIFSPVDGDDFSPGLNIIDKPYVPKFPFDFPVLNTIDSDQGIIDYRKKGFQKKIRSEGVIATIKLQAIRPTTKTTFRVFLNESGEEPTTGVFYRYHDRLGDPTDPFDGVTTCAVKVRPTTAYLKKYGDAGEG